MEKPTIPVHMFIEGEDLFLLADEINKPAKSQAPWAFSATL